MKAQTVVEVLEFSRELVEERDHLAARLEALEADANYWLEQGDEEHHSLCIMGVGNLRDQLSLVEADLGVLPVC
jgi:hypothetical protein